jgi:aminopeptidase N
MNLMGKKVKRLFKEFQPSHYQLRLQPDKAKMLFSGSVEITGKKTSRPSQRITLHQHGLTISKATVVYHGKKETKTYEVDRINNQASFDEVRLHTKEMLYPGEYTVRLEFSGKITKPMNGIYPAVFNEGKATKTILATQFESHHAREAFPCIDEPEAKATFDLTLAASKDETVLSNMPVKFEKTAGKLTETTFETTPVMSSYLLAFVIGELKYKEAKTKGGTKVRAYATPANTEFTDFALDVAVQCLEFYNEYFAIPYPLKKSDMVALPDFAAGAMENWGLVTYREQCMLVDPTNTSLATKQYVAMVVAHELAHQWFGNLVTMRWWTDLWLNEGFASWIEYLAVDHIFPEWHMWTQFIADEQQVALKLDALEHTHPIEVPVNHPDEIRTIFDTISYAKGASAIHMLEHYLGHDAFRDGLRYYLKQHAYKNTDTIDLWQALETVSGKPVKKFMHAWTSQSGYPVIKAQVEENKLSLSQERFFLNKSAHKKEVSSLWPVPLLSGAAETPDLLEKRSASVELADSANFKLNIGQSGFYRTAYNATQTHHLGELVRRGKLEPIERLGILADSFEVAKAGYGPTDDALDLLNAYSEEDNAMVWDVIASNLGDIRAVMREDELREAIKPYVRHLVTKQLERLGWEAKEGESHFDTLLRPTILGMASVAEEPAVVGPAIERFKAMKKPEDIEPNLRSVVYGTVARNGDKVEFDKLLKMHNSTTNSEERTTLAAALTGFKQPALIKRALALITTDDVRMQDVAYWVAYSFANRHARDETWKWMVGHWDWLDKNLGTDMSFSRFPLYSARHYSDRAFLMTYKKFFDSVMTTALERSVKQGIEIIEWHADWVERDYKEILAFFKASQPEP